MREIWPGDPFPLGATWDGGGTNFSLFSENATQVELCLFGDDPWPLDGEPLLTAGDVRDGALQPLAGAVVR